MYISFICVSGSSVGIATELRAGRSGIESRGGRDFPPVQTGPGAHPTSCKIGTEFFPGVKCGRGVLLTTHPLLVPRSWNSRAIPLPTLWATPGLQRDHFTSTCHLFNDVITSSDYVHPAVCLTTGVQLLPKRILHTVRSSTSCFNLLQPLLSSRSSISCLPLLPRLPFTPFPLSLLQ